MVATAAAVVAAAGIVAVATKEDATKCASLKARLATIEERYGLGSAQSWDDILSLQESATISQAYRANSERERILRDLAASDCA